MVPLVGGCACLSLAAFQGLAVPAAGRIAVIWLSLGGLLFLALFARQARLRDITRTALDPELLALRGRSPLVLVPIANPQSVEAMIALASALVPADVGRVLVQSVVVAPHGWRPGDDPQPFLQSQAVLNRLLVASAEAGIRVETLTTVASQPMKEIARVARLHRCDSVLLGMSEIADDTRGTRLESLLGTLDANVVVLRAPPAWQLADARRLLVPVGGRGGHEHLLVQLLGSLLRTAQREVDFLRVVPVASRPAEIRRARRELDELVDDQFGERCLVRVVASDDPLTTIGQHADDSDLVIMGAQRLARREKLFGKFTRALAQRTECPIVVLSRRG